MGSARSAVVISGRTQRVSRRQSRCAHSSRASSSARNRSASRSSSRQAWSVCSFASNSLVVSFAAIEKVAGVQLLQDRLEATVKTQLLVCHPRRSRTRRTG
jgi:hypothetical protein